MKKSKYWRIALLLNLFLLFSYFEPTQVFPQTTVKKNFTPREIAQQTLPSTVLIVMGNRGTKKIKSGSGFFVDEDVVATNFHVIKDTTEGYVKIYGQDKIYKILGTVGVDEKNDLALLKISGIKGKPLKLNTDDSIAIGDEVFAVGNPEGLEGTFSQGIVSSIRKTDKFNFLQITASISEGSSGGAVLNDKAEVVGVAVGAIESGQSLNFAIRVSFLRSLILNKKPLAQFAVSGITIDNNQANSNKVTQQPNKFPIMDNNPQRPSKIKFKVPDLERQSIIGNVELIKEFLYIPEKKFDEWVTGKAVSQCVERYNIDGYIQNSEAMHFSEKGSCDEDSLWLIFLAKDYPASTKNIYYYDYQASLITKETYNKCSTCSVFELDWKFITKYAENEVTMFYPDGKIHLKKIIQKTNNGKINELTYDGNGNLSGKSIISKSSVGELIESWYPTKVDKTQLELRYKTLKTETKNELKEEFTCVKEKDVGCNLTSVRDKSTNLILSSESGTNFFKYEYEFDSNKNWIRKTEYQRVRKFGKTYFEPSRIITREIKYY